ncbi:MAG: hypothetical protein WCT28_02725 [Patescibacteria group bacterium]|jgi:hypothetical protein
MTALFGYISFILSILKTIPYARDIFLKKTKPERASWLIWTLLVWIAFFSQLAKGATDSLWLTAGVGITALLIFSLSLKFGVGGFTRRDVTALGIAGLGLVFWYITNEPIYALAIAIAIDAIGTLLTAIKSYEHPFEETLIAWITAIAIGIFGVLAVGSFEPFLLAYPVYITVANVTIVTCLIIGRHRQRKQSIYTSN